MENKIQNLELHEIIERFETIEKKLKLDESRILGVPWWDMVRYPLFEILLKKKTNTKKIKITFQSSLINKLVNLKRFFIGISTLFSSKSAIWIKKNCYVIWGNARRKKENNFYIDIYSEPFVKLFSEKNNFYILEKEIGHGHRKPVKYNNNYYYAEQLFALAYLLSIFNITKFNRKELLVISKLEKIIYEKFYYKIDILKLVQKRIRRWRAIYPFMRSFFEFKKIKIFITVGFSGSEPVIAAAKSLNITTIDLQHGSFARGKMNYDYKSGIKNSSFPDYLLTFGDFWKLNFSFPINKDKVTSFGYPYLNEKYEKYSHIKRENRILIVSQGLKEIETGLVNFTVDLKKYFSEKFIVEFRPHPSTFFFKEPEYFKKLKDNNILISGRDDDLYLSFAKSCFQVGVYSTALYEGLKFGVPCYVLKIDRFKFMQELVDAKVARYISDPKDIDLNWSLNNEKINEIFSNIDKKKINYISSLFKN